MRLLLLFLYFLFLTIILLVYIIFMLNIVLLCLKVLDFIIANKKNLLLLCLDLYIYGIILFFVNKLLLCVLKIKSDLLFITLFILFIKPLFII